MRHQQAISARRLRRKVGTRQQVIIDEVTAQRRQVGPGRRRDRGQGPHARRRAARSTALSTSQAAARCAWARSRRCGSNAPTNTTCMARWWGFSRCPCLTLCHQHRGRRYPCRGHSRRAPTTFVTASRQFRELVLADRERRREIDDGTERPDEYALLHEPRAQGLEIVDAVKLDDADRALHPHVLDARKAAARRKAALERARDIGNLPQARFALEQVERGVGGGAGERVCHEGRPVHQRVLGSSDQKASKTLSRATVAASGSVPPVNAFDRVMMSGTTPAASQANRVPVRPKPVKISSKISSSW